MPLPLLSYLLPMRTLSAHADVLLCRRTILRRGVVSLAMKSLNSTAVLFHSHKLLFLPGQGSQPKSKPRHEQTKFTGSSKGRIATTCNDHPYNPSCAVEGTMDMASCSVLFGLLLTSRRITYPSWSEQYLLGICLHIMNYLCRIGYYVHTIIHTHFSIFICCGHVHCILCTLCVLRRTTCNIWVRIFVVRAFFYLIFVYLVLCVDLFV